MAVLTLPGLEPAGYWAEVCALANDLLEASPLRDWTVTIRPRAARPGPPRAGAERWTCEADHANRRFDVGAPADAGAVDEELPEDVASHIVLDLLHATVGGRG